MPRARGYIQISHNIIMSILCHSHRRLPCQVIAAAWSENAGSASSDNRKECCYRQPQSNNSNNMRSAANWLQPVQLNTMLSKITTQLTITVCIFSSQQLTG